MPPTLSPIISHSPVDAGAHVDTELFDCVADCDRTLDADSVHHCSNVVGALLEGCHFHGPIGKPGASLVESDQAAKAAEPLEEKRSPRYLPVEVEIRHGSRRQHHVDGTVACDLIGDQHIVAAGIFCLGQQWISRKWRRLASWSVGSGIGATHRDALRAASSRFPCE
jgi:hypothetical protein